MENKISKRFYLGTLIVFAIIGSLLTVFATNLLAGDIATVGYWGKTIVADLPAVMMAAIFVFITLYLIKLYRHPKTFKRMTKLYLILLVVFSGLGVVGCILTGTVAYGDFLAPYPFTGYPIIFLILHLMFLGFGISQLLKLRRVKDDLEVRKLNFLQVLKNIGYVLFIGLVFNRFGYFLGMPLYVYWRYFYATFPFYLYLLMPVAIGVFMTMRKLDMLPKGKGSLIFLCIVAGLHVVLAAYIIIMGANDTLFVSSVSACMPLERFASMPVELIIHVVAYTALLTYYIVKVVKEKKAEQQQ
ncbi:MAG: hypothetical protein K5925_01470 [Bacilli bacterium]|nr:hypothetical protein [Bacilli bacterium]